MFDLKFVFFFFAGREGRRTVGRKAGIKEGRKGGSGEGGREGGKGRKEIKQ